MISQNFCPFKEAETLTSTANNSYTVSMFFPGHVMETTFSSPESLPCIKGKDLYNNKITAK